jgi:hypothetical protein
MNFLKSEHQFIYIFQLILIFPDERWKIYFDRGQDKMTFFSPMAPLWRTNTLFTMVHSARCASAVCSKQTVYVHMHLQNNSKFCCSEMDFGFDTRDLQRLF